MSRYWLTPNARSNLEEILTYSNVNWGSERAKKYLGQLKNAFDLLACNPALGRERSELFKKCRSYSVNSHVIFYLQEEVSIMIIAVLHEKMDVRRILDK